MSLGGHPIASYYLGIPTNATIAASMGGTAASTKIVSSIAATYVRYMEVFNLTGRNMELFFGPDIGTTAFTAQTPSGVVALVNGGTLFCPGTTSSTPGAGRGNYFPIVLSPGMQMWARTTENTPITAASTTPLIIQFWA